MMNVADLAFRYDTAQKLLKIHIETDTEDTSVSDHYVLLHLPQRYNPAKSGWQVTSATKTEVEAIYNDDLPYIGLQVTVTSGASAYDVRVTATAADGTVYEGSGKTGTALAFQVPIADHPDAGATVHNSTLPPPADTLAIDPETGHSIPGTLMFPPTDESVGAHQSGQPGATLVS